MKVERVSLPVDDPLVDRVSAAIHRPRRAAKQPASRPVLLVPGAGGDLDGSGLTALASALTEQGCTVVRANLPYRERGRRAPRAGASVDGLLAVLAAARQLVRARKSWIVGGKSYGGRVASLAVAGGLNAAGLLLYGYPLHPIGKPENLRVDHWPQVDVPVLFLQGDRDPHCDLRLLKGRMRKLPRRATLHVVAGGDHQLRVTAKASPDGVPASDLATIAGLSPVLATWLTSLTDEGVPIDAR